EGWLHKRSDRFKTWNKRWFILRDSSLFYFKNPKDNKMKGIICLQGYRVIADPSTSGNKRYGFKLYHDRERVFQFYTDTPEEMKKWMQALMKTTIKRDLCAPVVSSNNMSTVSLDVAQ
ncbi:PH domain-like protein, partial [Backusella circina FSU 941]